MQPRHPRAALRLLYLTPPLQLYTHRTPGCAQLKRRRHSAARSTCAAASAMCAPRHSAPTRCVQVQEQLCRRALHARADGLDAADHLLCEGAVCTRVCDRVLRRCHAAPKRCGSELELSAPAAQLATADPSSSQPAPLHSRLMMPVHVGGRLADSGDEASLPPPTTRCQLGLTLKI